MKIWDIKLYVLNELKKVFYVAGWSKNYNIVKIYTNEGIYGIGETFYGVEEPVETCLKKYAQQVFFT